MTEPRIRVLFVCLGNICRSPLAEGVFRHLVSRAGLADRFEIDSAGTSGYHIGDPPDPRTTRVAAARGVPLTSRARQIGRADLDGFDYVIVMDAENLSAVRRLATRSAAEVRMLREFDPEAEDPDVPDPYFGGERGFETVHDIVEAGCVGLLQHIRHERGI